jgi:hypothetical protein
VRYFLESPHLATRGCLRGKRIFLPLSKERMNLMLAEPADRVSCCLGRLHCLVFELTNPRQAEERNFETTAAIKLFIEYF